jgi:hypothetical protein
VPATDAIIAKVSEQIRLLRQETGGTEKRADRSAIAELAETP